MVPVELVGVRVEMPANVPVMMLREMSDPGRILPIYIGAPEASAIHLALEGIEPPRPLTHDLIVLLVDALAVEVREVVISEMREHTFYAELVLMHDGSELRVSCRPSDAVAIAVRASVPIFAAREVLNEAGHVPESESSDLDEIEDGVDPDEILDEFRSFIDQVNPEDFGSS
jgi:bifunctional DNase/RNase